MSARDIFREWRKGCSDTFHVGPWRCWFCTKWMAFYFFKAILQLRWV